jgi:hypothetical protein
MSLIPSSQATADYYTLELKDYTLSVKVLLPISLKPQLCYTARVASDLWLKVILFFLGDMDVTGNARVQQRS